jgi:Htaa
MARRPRRPLVLAALVLVLSLAALAAGVAKAQAQVVQLDGVKTQLTTDPATTKVLIKNAIVPLPVGRTGFGPVLTKGGLAARYSFPITGGSLDAATLAGTIDHAGGIKFLNLRNWKSLTLTKFRIEIGANPGLTAEVNRDPSVRVRILDLDLSAARIDKSRLPYVTVKNVGATLTATAAGALNQTLGVELFQEGIKLGTANVYARIAG